MENEKTKKQEELQSRRDFLKSSERRITNSGCCSFSKCTTTITCIRNQRPDGMYQIWLWSMHQLLFWIL